MLKENVYKLNIICSPQIENGLKSNCFKAFGASFTHLYPFIKLEFPALMQNGKGKERKMYLIQLLNTMENLKLQVQVNLIVLTFRQV